VPDTPSPERLHPLAGERLMTFARAAAELPSRSGRCHPSTVWRWAFKGCRTLAGRVRLEHVKVGGVWYTSAEAVRRFLDQVNVAAAGETGPPPRPEAQRQRAAERAGTELEALGI
jgi:Protein of unknown function (DUF1580)